MSLFLKGNVTIPPRPHTIGGLISWGRAVNRALTELRDRKIVGVTAKGPRPVTIKPLTIKQGSAADKFQIVPGYVNTLMPTLSGTELDDDTRPEFTVTATASVYVKTVGTFASPDTYVVTIHITTSGFPIEEISATNFTSYFLIGDVGFTAGSPPTYNIFNYHSGGNLGIESFGNINLWWNL